MKIQEMKGKVGQGKARKGYAMECNMRQRRVEQIKVKAR